MATAEGRLQDRRHIPDRRGSNRGAAVSPRRMSAVDWIAMTLLIIGGLNWGLVGLFDLDLVAMLFGEMSAVSRVIYVLVGLSALYSIYTASKLSRPR